MRLSRDYSELIFRNVSSSLLICIILSTFVSDQQYIEKKNMNNSNNRMIRFDWAMKRLLRNKANFSVLEGLLTTLLGEKIVIQKLLESDQEDQFDKYNRVDMLAEN